MQILNKTTKSQYSMSNRKLEKISRKDFFHKTINTILKAQKSFSCSITGRKLSKFDTME